MKSSRFAAIPATRQHRRPKLGNNINVRKHRPDYLLLVLMCALLVCGAVVVYSIGPGLTKNTDLSTNYYTTKQITAIILGFIGFTIASVIPIENWRKFQPYIIAAAVFSAIIVRFVGDEVNGVHRWIQLGGFSFQPAELIKLALVIWLAGFLAEKRIYGKINDKDTLKQLGIVMLVIVVVVAGLQSDLGSAAVMLAIIGIVTFIAGMPLKNLAIVGLVLVMAATIAISTSSYRRERVTTFLNPTADCQDEGYQACQALLTIGSGGLSGKGLGQSVQAYGYLPEPQNDSIFAIVGEKFGYVGAISILAIFWVLFRRISKVAMASSTDYTRLLVSGILVWLSVQSIINIGAMMGLLPLKGITLPFVSYGGTSIIFVMIAIGIVFQASRYTELTSKESKSNDQSTAPLNRFKRKEV